MRFHALIAMALVGLLCGLPVAGGATGAAAPPEKLALSDLVNRPDRWPATVALQKELRFKSGAVARQGEQVHVVGFDGTRVSLLAGGTGGTGGNVLFALSPQDCGLLDAANQAWALLSPAQRAVDPETLAADRSIWPLRVTTTTAITCQFGKLPAGTEVGLLTISGRLADIAWPNSPNRLNLDVASTDVIARARKLVLIDTAKRPSRMAAALRDILVDGDGKAYHDPHLEEKTYFALYFGANWCAPCHAFSPDLVKFLDATLPKHAELAAVLLSNDKNPAEMFAYMKEGKLPMPAVPLKDLNQSGILNSYAGKLIPTVVIVDRFGKLLATSDDNRGNRIDPNDTLAALGKMLEAPATQP